ncbi:MAG: hypothetical protein EXS38_10915 [Opitutus sp.]|nr:hypothetical protein [Opitutus sp.]
MESRLELFVDDALIERMDGLRLQLHEPRRAEKVLEFDRPWEGATCAYFTLVQDQGLYRLYYRGAGNSGDPREAGNDRHSETHPMSVCCVESRDGVNWTRPNLGLVEFRGSKDNNIVWMGQEAMSFYPFLDTNPDARPAERYKAAGVGILPGRKEYVLIGFTSPDGLRWTKLGDRSIIPDESPNAFDSQNVVFWDQLRGKYIAFYRAQRGGTRWSKYGESTDFANWPADKLAWFDYTGAPMDQLYNNAARPYPRAPHIYVGFPNRYVSYRSGPEHGENFGVNDALFMSSRDGVHWDRRFREAFLRPGRDARNWGDRSNYVAAGMLQTSPDELSFYYTQNYRYPSAHLRRGVLRLDGMVSVRADAAGGEIVTKPFRYRGNALVINYETSAAGSLRFELQDERGNAIPGYALEDSPPLWGDQVEHVVTWTANPRWGTSLEKMQGIAVRLRIAMRDADLYSFQFRTITSKP